MIRIRSLAPAHIMARIVLLDDEARLLQTLARFLEQQGHTVVRGTRWSEVEAHVHPGRFEVLVSDIVMPEVDGLKVLREVVEGRQCLEPVILITGEPSLQTASEAVRRGAFDYISKPVTKDKLLEAVARGLRHVQLLRERDQARQSEMQVLRNLAALGESASVLSHEIRTPITSLRHALRAVGDKLGIDDRVLVEEFVGNLNKIERLLGQTLSFAKPLHLQRQDSVLAVLVEHAVREVAALPAAGRMSFDQHVEPGLRLHVDPQLFGEVLTNVLRNAVEACNGAGHVQVDATCLGGRLQLDIADDGPGVPAHLAEEIFKPFRSSKEYGTGIGLAFCRKVIESHGGAIIVVQKEGAGACFRIDLPPTSFVTGGPAAQGAMQ
ncbi:MAG: hybrid sensor histidine kinase/response regulator [Planctomycetes bacterium]|nr:hybrid sensor histidine kinase/response regulator [Planctomycetota bacterium]